MSGLISKSHAAHLNKTSARRSRSGRSAAIALAALAAAAWAGRARATTLFIWDPDGNAANNNQSGAGVGGSGSWNNSTINWWYSTAATTGTETAWNSSLQACISGASTNNITLGSNIVDTQGILSYVNYNIEAGTNTLQLGGTVIVSGGVATIAAPVVGTGFTSESGTLVLGGSNTFSGFYNLSGGQVTIDSSTALGTATFDITAASSIDTNGQTLVNNNAQIWNANFTFIGSGALNMGTGGVSLGTAAGTTRTVTVNANTLTVGGDISNGTTANSLTVAGGGTLALTGSNTYTGSTTVNSGATLSLSGSLSSSSSLVLAGGTFSVAASQAGQSLVSTSVTGPGSQVIAAYTGSNTLALGALTRTVGATVDFTLPPSGSITTTTANASFLGGQQTILGGYATVSGASWAVSGSGATPGAITALPQTSYSSTFTSGADVDAPTGSTTPGTMTINSLRFNNSSNTYAINDSGAGDTLTVATGGILETANVGGNSVTLSMQNLTSGNGSDLIVIQNNPSSPMTINSNIVGNISLTKTGSGPLVLNGSNAYTGTTYLSGSGSVTEEANTTLNVSNATNTNFTGGLIMNAGTLEYNADNNLGAHSSGVTLNNAIVEFTGTSAITDSHVFTISGGGGTFNVVNPGAAGGKITFSTAGQITGSGNLTKTGPGWLSIGAANSTYTGSTIINAGVIEASAGALGTGSVTINGDGSINPATAGELAANNTTLSNFIILNGGILGGDNGTSTFSGNVNVEANSTIRLGDFYGATNRSLTISGELVGSGNLKLVNGNGATPIQPSLQILTLSSTANGGYSGTLSTDAGHDIRFTNSGAEVPLLVKSTTTALTEVMMGTATFTIPTISNDPAGTSQGVLGAYAVTATEPINFATADGGALADWFLGGDTSGVSYDAAITPGTGNIYRLAGGGGGIFLGTTGELSSIGVGAIIGDTRLGGTGTVKFGAVQSYTGSTTVAAGSTVSLDFTSAGAQTNLMPVGTELILDGGGYTDTGKASTNSSQGIAGITFNPGGSSSVAVVSAATNNNLFTLGPITRNTGGTVAFTEPTVGNMSATLNGITTTTPNAYGAILGGYATVGGTGWATSAGSAGSPGLITALVTYNTGAGAFSTGYNTDAATGTTVPGTVSINSLRFNNAGAYTLNDSGSGDTLTITSGGILETSTVGANAVTFSMANLATGNGTDLIITQNNTSAAMTINSLISGTTALTKSGSGGLVLNDANTFSGTTYDNGGSITLTNSLALQNSIVSFDLQAGTLLFGSGLTSATVAGLSGNQSVTLSNTAATPAAVTLTVNNPTGGSSVYSGNMSGLGGVTVAGTGTFTMSGSANSYTGATTVNGGVLNVSGSITGNGPVTVNGGVLSVNGSITGTTAVTVNGGGTLSGIGSVTGPVIVAGGSSNATQGSVSLIPNGTVGTLTLLNGLTVGSSVSPSILGFNINATTSSNLNLSSSTFTVNAGGATIQINSLVNGTSIVSGTTYNLMNFSSGTGAGFSTGSGTSVGALALASPVVTFGVTGSLIVSSTSVQLVTSVASAPSTAYWSGVWGATWSATDPTTTDGNFTTDPGGVNYVNSYPASNTNVIFSADGNGAPTNLTNTLGLNFDINSLTFLSGNPTTSIGGAQQLTIEGGGITVQSGAGQVTLSMASLVLDQGQTWTNSSANPLTVSSNVSGGGSLTTVGNVIMTGTNNYSGGATVSSGELQLGGGGSLNTTGNLTVNGTLDMNGSNVSVAALSGASTGIITNGPGASGNVTLATNSSSGTAFAGVISDSGPGKTLSLLINGNGSNSLILSGANSYTGGTTLNAGTLVAGSSSPLGSGPLVATAGTFDLNAAGSNSGGAQSVSIGTLSGASATITDNNGNSGVTTLNVNQTSPTTFGGTITDGPSRQVALSVSGPGTLTLTTAGNNYSGGTTISAGASVISAAPGTIGSGPVTLSTGSLSLLGATISGFGVNGTGWTVNQAGTYSITPTPITNNVLTLTDNSSGGGQGRFAFFDTPESVSNGFTANFVYTVGGSKLADGFSFDIENDPRGANITDGTGGSLGVTGLADSGNVVFNLYSDVSDTGFDTDGTSDTAANNMNASSNSINLHTGGPSFDVSLSYNPSAQTLTETVTDQTTPSDVYTTTYTGVNFQSLLGSNSGYVGFTGSDGGAISSQTISDFVFQNGQTVTWGNNVVAAGPNSSIHLGVQSTGLGSVTVQAGASLAIIGSTPTGQTGQVLSITGLTIAGNAGNWTGKLDLGGSDMIIGSGSLATVTSQIAEGYATGTWQGSGGIVSSAAAADTTHLTALGVMQNTVDGVNPLYVSFDGVTGLTASDILVKYTYYGDANLSGTVDASDYSLIDNGYLNQLTGWYNGDFNYDGVINGSDYTLIDNAFNMQGASLATEVASATDQISGGGTSAVPEPASIALLGVGALGLLGRRRRK